MRRFVFAASAIVVVAGALSGCQWAPKSKLVAAQAQGRMLAEQSKAQLAQIENLKIHTRQVEDQLIRAEAELARAPGGAGSLAAVPLTPRAGQAALDGPLSERLAELIRRYPSAQYDRRAGVVSFDADRMFDPNQVDLKPTAQQVLDELAALLRSSAANDVKLLVVSHNDPQGFHARATHSKLADPWYFSSARALAVAERLRKSGVPDERVGVAGFAEPQATAGDSGVALAQRRIDLYLLGADASVVGWQSPESRVLR